MLPISLLYNRLPSPSLLPWLESITYTDRMAGRASTLAVSLCNADGRFLSSWRATLGDSLSLRIPPASAEAFAITKIAFIRAPAVVTWEAEAKPATTRSPSGRGSGTPPPSKGALVSQRISWPQEVKGVRLSELAQRVCGECGLSLRYVAKSDPRIAYTARYDETGYHLLSRYCRRYALELRATASEVIIMAAQSQGDKSPPASMSIGGGVITALAQASDVTPRSVRSARLDPRSAKPVRLSAGDGIGVDIDVGYDADAAAAIYAAAVAESVQASVDIVPTAGIVAGSIVDIAGVGLREVLEMRYTRSGDAERMSLTVREAR